MKFIHFFFAIEVEPDQDRAGIAVRLPERWICQKDPALTLGDTGDATLLASPVLLKAKMFFVVANRPVDIADGNLRNCSGKVEVHSCL